ALQDLENERPPWDVPLSLAEVLNGVVHLAEVPVKDHGWLWPGRVPVGSVTSLVGPRGAGKSYLVAEIAARVSRGEPWPDEPSTQQDAGDVLILTAEDDVDTVITPRLRACGADLDRVHVVDCRREDEEPAEITLRNVEDAASAVPGLRLIVIDPIAEVVGTRNDRRTDGLRVLFNQLARFAARRRIAIVLVNANDKVSAGKTWQRGVDIVPFLDANARAVWTLESDPGHGRRRLLLPLRCNLAPNPTGLAFEIEHRSGKVSWDPEPVELVAESLRPQSRKKTGIARAAAWLRAYLEDGPRTAGEVLHDAELAGFSRGALYGAKMFLKVPSAKLTDEANGGWVWILPVVEFEQQRDFLQDSKICAPANLRVDPDINVPGITVYCVADLDGDDERPSIKSVPPTRAVGAPKVAASRQEQRGLPQDSKICAPVKAPVSRDVKVPPVKVIRAADLDRGDGRPRSNVATSQQDSKIRDRRRPPSQRHAHESRDAKLDRLERMLGLPAEV